MSTNFQLRLYHMILTLEQFAASDMRCQLNAVDSVRDKSAVLVWVTVSGWVNHLGI